MDPLEAETWGTAGREPWASVVGHAFRLSWHHRISFLALFLLLVLPPLVAAVGLAAAFRGPEQDSGVALALASTQSERPLDGGRRPPPWRGCWRAASGRRWASGFDGAALGLVGQAFFLVRADEVLRGAPTPLVPTIRAVLRRTNRRTGAGSQKRR